MAEEVSVGGANVWIYGTAAGALTYYKQGIGFDAMIALSSSDRLKRLVQAARVLTRQDWRGNRTDEATPQPLAFPRTGLIDKDGVAVDDATEPEDVAFASYELAALLNDDDATIESEEGGSNVKQLATTERVEGAVTDSTSTTYFKPTIGKQGRFPRRVQELVGLWLEASGAGTLACASGTDFPSEFTAANRDFGLNEPF